MAWVERRAIVPERTVIRTEQRGGEVLTMPGYLPDHAVVGVKVWSRFELDRGPETSATILYRDLVRGTEVVIDGTLITELRTSVMSVVASRHLARSDARTVAIVGAGRQGRAHLDAFAALMPIERIIVTSRRSETRDHLVVQAQSANPHMRIESGMIPRRPHLPLTFSFWRLPHPPRRWRTVRSGPAPSYVAWAVTRVMRAKSICTPSRELASWRSTRSQVPWTERATSRLPSRQTSSPARMWSSSVSSSRVAIEGDKATAA